MVTAVAAAPVAATAAATPRKSSSKAAPVADAAASASPTDVLSYWFEDDKTQFRRKWFMSSKEDDEALKTKFGDAIAAAKRGELAGWEGNARSALALVILLDQFGRSVHRGSAEAFAGDALALKVCLVCMAHGWDKSMSPMERMFLYMPLEHSEDPTMMRLCLSKMADITEVPAALDFAKTHADILERFGRYPHRNAVLGRESTQAELDYLKSADTFGQ
ncbi:hypothetical protein FNF28_05703 [Cafeteria roenbergensis]|uniref:DUF924 domain-containing protein n=1 Tax=Cafeteria roenbergensis TaxID=33653 RepID=A0A5A8D2Y0_CAFRO|nr:hypothetical protein FNF28_05703 [Cafeteria roenbergensis]